MKTLIVFTAAILAVSALSLHEQWADFKVKHGKTYQNIVEEKLRFENFQQTLKKIEEHNAKYQAGLTTFWMGVNKFSDLTEDEFMALMTKQIASKPKLATERHVQANVSVPDSIDWREKNAVLAVKDQGQCGSCWAFSATGSIEGQNAIKNGGNLPLSEQQPLDCSSSYGNGDCSQGGNMDAGFEYVRDHGIESEDHYPYVAEKGSCKANGRVVLKIKGFRDIEQNTEALKQAVGTVGPISVAIYAGSGLQSYAGGIFDGNCAGPLNHGVLAVGYGEGSNPHWIVKNSWGQNWGENGYFRLARRNNLCKISDDPSYPVL